MNSSISIYEILKFLPHRYPFLLVDKVLDYKPGEYLQAVKNVSVNEQFFVGHFPEKPVMPGVLILEALAQAGGVLLYLTAQAEQVKSEPDSLYLLAGIDNARFKQVVSPGDQLILRTEFVKRKRDIIKMHTEASVNDKVVCTADLMCAYRRFASDSSSSVSTSAS